MSFYQGAVAKLIKSDQELDHWLVVDVLIINTNDDQNINIDFSHGSIPRAAFVPTTLIHDFDSKTTKKIKRTLDKNTGIERWESMS